MRTEEFDQILDRAWASSRSVGVIGESTDRIREHAAGYVPAAWRVRAPRRLVDLGSGVGVPGLHLADLLQSTEVVLVDSSAQRCAVAEAAAADLGLDERVSVVQARVDDLGRDPAWRGSADGVVSRLLGPPAEVAECGIPLLAVGGRLVVSVNSAAWQWWESAPLADLGCVHEAGWSSRAGSYVAVRKVAVTPARFPRRTPARRRAAWPGS